jgi:membrane-associated phospholipid phosphatase
MEKWIENAVWIGMYGPVILFIIAIWQLYSRVKYLFWFLVLMMLNECIVIVTKQIIREPRPEILINDPSHPSYYGMPSGHSLHSTFIWIYLWLVCPSWAIFCINSVIVGITMMHRYIYKRHTLSQIAVGGIGGGVLAYIYVNGIRNYYNTH